VLCPAHPKYFRAQADEVDFVLSRTARGECDWLVREDGGRELGHYPTRKEAEAVREKIQRSRPPKGRFAR
jgi:hypothetical protein